MGGANRVVKEDKRRKKKSVGEDGEEEVHLMGELDVFSPRMQTSGAV